MKKAMIGLKGISLFIFILSFFPGMISLAQNNSVESGQVPREIIKPEYTLIGVLKGRKSYDKYVEKAFSNYTGNYVLATTEEIETKYPDKDKYRYLMDCEIEIRYRTTPNGTTSTSVYHYYILDRKKNRKFFKKSKSSFFAMEMKSYIKDIESLRKK